MRSVISAAARIGVLCSAAVMAGCGGPQTGDQLKISDADQQRIGQGIKAAMKAGMYDNPMRKPGAAKVRRRRSRRLPRLEQRQQPESVQPEPQSTGL